MFRRCRRFDLAGAAGLFATTTHGPVEAPVRAEAMNPSRIAMNAKTLPVEEYHDYSIVFN
jgi:hypothetical protein